MEKENLDLKTAIQIAKIISSAPEDRLPMIWDIFSKAGLDIGGLDEMAEWKALTRQAYLIDTGQFLAGVTEGLEPVGGEYRIRVDAFNSYCTKQKLSARCTRKHLAGLGIIRTVKLCSGKVDYTCAVYEKETTYRAVCIYADWKQRIGADRKEEDRGVSGV